MSKTKGIRIDVIDNDTWKNLVKASKLLNDPPSKSYL